MNKSNWIILIVIMLMISVLILYSCGLGVGMMMLIIMNGMSEKEALPLLVVFALVVLGVSVLISAQFGWLYVRMRGAENVGFMQVLKASAAANLGLIVLALLAVFVVRMTG